MRTFAQSRWTIASADGFEFTVGGAASARPRELPPTRGDEKHAEPKLSAYCQRSGSRHRGEQHPVNCRGGARVVIRAASSENRVCVPEAHPSRSRRAHKWRSSFFANMGSSKRVYRAEPQRQQQQQETPKRREVYARRTAPPGGRRYRCQVTFIKHTSVMRRGRMAGRAPALSSAPVSAGICRLRDESFSRDKLPDVARHHARDGDRGDAQEDVTATSDSGTTSYVQVHITVLALLYRAASGDDRAVADTVIRRRLRFSESGAAFFRRLRVCPRIISMKEASPMLQ